VIDDTCERGVPGGAVNLNYTGYSDYGCYGDLSLQGNIPTADPAIEPGTSWLVVTSVDHQAKRLVPTAEVGCCLCRILLATLKTSIVNKVWFKDKKKLRNWSLHCEMEFLSVNRQWMFVGNRSQHLTVFYRLSSLRICGL
jgi:hypothetical protein